MYRVKAQWSGFVGGPGYSNFYFETANLGTPTEAEAGNGVDRVHAFFDAIKGVVPNPVHIQVDNNVEVVDVVTGVLEDVVSAPSVGVVNSSASSSLNYAAATGAVVNWRTAGVRNGRKVRGRTFIVPMHSMAFAPDGTLDAGHITAISGAAATLRTTTDGVRLVIWARPIGSPGTGGDIFDVTSHTVPDMGAVLRSRRD